MVEALTVQAGAGSRAPGDLIATDRQSTPASGGLIFDLVALAASLPGAGKVKATSTPTSDAIATNAGADQAALAGTADPLPLTKLAASEPATDKAPVSVDALVAMDKAAKQGLEARLFVPKPETEWSIHILPSTQQPSVSLTGPTDLSPLPATDTSLVAPEPTVSDAVTSEPLPSDSASPTTDPVTYANRATPPTEPALAEIPTPIAVIAKVEAQIVAVTVPDASNGAVAQSVVENDVSAARVVPAIITAEPPLAPEASTEAILGPTMANADPSVRLAIASTAQLTSTPPSTQTVPAADTARSSRSETASGATPHLSISLRRAGGPSLAQSHPINVKPAPTFDIPQPAPATILPTSDSTPDAFSSLGSAAPIAYSTPPVEVPNAPPSRSSTAPTSLGPTVPRDALSWKATATIPASASSPVIGQAEPTSKKAGPKADHRLTESVEPVAPPVVVPNDSVILTMPVLPQGTPTESAQPSEMVPKDDTVLVSGDDRRNAPQQRPDPKPTAFFLPPAKSVTPARTADKAPTSAESTVQGETAPKATPSGDNTTSLEKSDNTASDQNPSGSPDPHEFIASTNQSSPVSEGSTPSLIPSTFEQDLLTVAQGASATSAATLDDLPSHVTVEAVSLHSLGKSHEAESPSAPADVAPIIVSSPVADDMDHTSGVIVDTTRFHASTSSQASLSTTTNGAPPASSAIRTDSPSFIAQRDRAMEQQIIAAIRGGHDEIRLSLYPAQLGQVTINMALDGQKVRVGMKTSNRDASTVLLGERQHLATSLGNEGFTLESFDVTDDRPREQTPDRQKPANSPAAIGHTTDNSFSLDITI